MMLENIDHCTAQVTVLDERIAVLCEPYERQVAQLDAIPGFGVITAQDLIAEIGTDMTAFPTAGHLVLLGPGRAPRRESEASGRGRPPPAAATPTSAARSARPPRTAGRTQTFLGAKLRRLSRRMPKKKALGAIMRSQLVIAHALLSDPAAELPATSAPATPSRAHDARRQARNHLLGLERLGYKVTIENRLRDPEPGELSPAPPANRRHRPARSAGKPTAQTTAGSKSTPG